MKFHGVNASLDLCLIDGGEELDDHVETIRINWRDGERIEEQRFLIPDPAGFLILKTAVCRYPRKTQRPI